MTSPPLPVDYGQREFPRVLGAGQAVRLRAAPPTGYQMVFGSVTEVARCFHNRYRPSQTFCFTTARVPSAASGLSR